MFPKKIMFVSYGGGHANIARLIYNELKKYNNIDLKVLALTMAGKIFDKYHVPYVTISHYLDLFEDKEEIVAFGQELAKEHWNKESGITYEDSVAYLGLGYRDLINRYGKEKAEKLFKNEERKAFWPVNVMKSILMSEKPDALIITCGVRSEGASGAAANILGIPVIRIADLPTYESSNCDCMLCVMNEYAKRYALEKYNIKEDRIVITGQPVFEETLKINLEEIEKSKKEINWINFNKIILYLEEAGLAETKDVENKLKEIAQIRQDFLFVFKLHPNQNCDGNKWISKNILVVRDFSLNNLLYLSDLAITKDSTAGLEAVLLEKPLINIMLSDSILDYSDYNISKKITNLEYLPEAILECLDKKSELYMALQEGRKSFVNRQNAANNIVKVIFSEIKNSKSQKRLVRNI